MFLPSNHWAHGRGAALKMHIAAFCVEASAEIKLILSLSVSFNGWTITGVFELNPIVTKILNLWGPPDGWVDYTSTLHDHSLRHSYSCSHKQS